MQTLMPIYKFSKNRVDWYISTSRKWDISLSKMWDLKNAKILNNDDTWYSTLIIINCGCSDCIV